MNLSQMLLPEFDQEMANTRKTLERVPAGKTDWKPHEKSMTLGRLAGHVAELPGWAVETLKRDELEVMPPGQPPQPFVSGSAQELLAMFDKKTAEARAALEQASNDDMMKPWTLKVRGNVAFTLPKAAVLRGFVMNHLIHHRAQLGVYLRLNDIPVPALYGPSADERPF
ncbi:MAG TPA: DinB family protein [Bryobacteraceae bacterium]|nr:DinB family protein [Bryobacteraceae bacterium]